MKLTSKLSASFLGAAAIGCTGGAVGHILIAGENGVLGVLVMLVVLAVGVVPAFFIVRSIVEPLEKMSHRLKELSKGEGNLTTRFNIRRSDEVGQVVQRVDEFMESFHNFVKNVDNNAVMLASGSEMFKATSEELLVEADDVNEKASQVAVAGEELSANVRTMATASEEMSTSANGLASAVEEMSASINEVSRNCVKESEIANQANTQASQAHSVMSELGQAAQEIGKVVEVINNIADQTNLLALNATIEAASAGEAGKGFAVVANEVKELARQSAQATEQISNQIEHIQNRTENAVGAIEEVTRIISEVTQIATAIAAAVEEQATTVKELTQTMSGVSEAAQDVARSVQEASEETSEISQSIHDVSETTEQATQGAFQVGAGAKGFSVVSDALLSLTKRFETRKAAFDIVEVKNTHMKWAARLGGLLAGRVAISIDEVSSSKNCSFGEWFYGTEGRKLEVYPEYGIVEKHYGDVRQHIKEAVGAMQAGNREQANIAVGKFEEARTRMFSALDGLCIASSQPMSKKGRRPAL